MSDEAGSIGEEGASIDSTSSEEISEEASLESSEDVETEVEGSEEPAAEGSEEEEAAEEVDPATQMYRLTVDGQDIEVSLQDMAQDYQLKAASHKRFQEASQLEKASKQAIEDLNKDPVKAMKDLGWNRESIKDYFYAQAKAMLEEDGMSEEEVKAKEELSELETLRAEKAAREDADKSAEDVRLQNEAIVNYNKAFTEELSKQSIPSTPHAVQRMAQIMHDALAAKYEISVPEAAAYYKEEQAAIVKHQLGDLKGEQLIKVLGKEAADKIRKQDLANLKNPAPSGNPPEQKPSKKSTHFSGMDFFENLKADSTD